MVFFPYLHILISVAYDYYAKNVLILILALSYLEIRFKISFTIFVKAGISVYVYVLFVFVTVFQTSYCGDISFMSTKSVFEIFCSDF